MSRDIEADALAAVQQPNIAHVYLVDFDFASGHVYLNTSDRTYVYDGNTYLGGGTIGSISGVKETAGTVPEQVTFVLPGVDVDLVATTLRENYHNRSVVIYVAYLDEHDEMSSTPFILWEGSMDKMLLHVDEKKVDITLACESSLILWNKSTGWLYTTEHQTRLWGYGDNFFSQIAPCLESVIVWLNGNTWVPYYSRTPPADEGPADW